MLLENVGALLSRQQECRRLLKYIIQANLILLQNNFFLCLFQLKQECRARGMTIHWTANRMNNVGIPAGPLHCQLSYVVVNPLVTKNMNDRLSGQSPSCVSSCRTQ